MQFLILHQNFPAQFIHLAPALAARGHRVVACSLNVRKAGLWNGVEVYPYHIDDSPWTTHPLTREFQMKILRAEGCAKALLSIQKLGFTPDFTIAHPGWGDALFVKEIWPSTRLGLYCEFYYGAPDSDVGFDPELSKRTLEKQVRARLKNTHLLLQLQMADAGIAPTHWQKSRFPEWFQGKIDVIHDGIDTDQAMPNPNATLQISENLSLSRAHSVITFVSRNLEPYRGYHRFMRALPEIMEHHPETHIIVIGGDGVSYGAPPPDPNTTWKHIFFNEVEERLPDNYASRLHFLGPVPYTNYLQALQISRAHIYLTYPFVLSWSLLEAMACGCPIIASDTQPVREIISPGIQNGHLIDFFDSAMLAQCVHDTLTKPQEAELMGANAQQTVLDSYDLQTDCLPQQIAWAETMGNRRR